MDIIECLNKSSLITINYYIGVIHSPESLNRVVVDSPRCRLFPYLLNRAVGPLLLVAGLQLIGTPLVGIYVLLFFLSLFDVALAYAHGRHRGLLIYDARAVPAPGYHSSRLLFP